MMTQVPLIDIQRDAQFRRDCDKAQAKANRAAKRVEDRLMAAEEKEVARHRKVMAEINHQRRRVFQDVFAVIYDPLEQEAFVSAEKRLGGAPD